MVAWERISSTPRAVRRCSLLVAERKNLHDHLRFVNRLPIELGGSIYEANRSEDRVIAHRTVWLKPRAPPRHRTAFVIANAHAFISLQLTGLAIRLRVRFVPSPPCKSSALFSLWRGMATKSNFDNSPNGKALRGAASSGKISDIISLVRAGTNVNGTDGVRRSRI